MKKTKNIIIRTIAIMCIAISLLSFSGGGSRKPVGMPEVISLWEAKNYFNWGSSLSGEFHTQRIVAMFQKSFGFKTGDVSTWGSAVNSMITKFSPGLSATQKQNISKSLSENAHLFEELSNLSDADQTRLVALLDGIVANQDKDHGWIYYAQAEPVLQEEYDILAKVWSMPKLFKSKKNYLGGHYYGFDKEPSTNPWHTPGDDKLLWNTRYLNNYQYAVGVFHRRCRDAGAITPAARREVAKNIASCMRQGAALLE